MTPNLGSGTPTFWLELLLFIKRESRTPNFKTNTIVAGYCGFTLMSASPSVRLSICYSFPDDNLSKHQWIFTKLGMCIDIVDIWFGIANGQILSIFYGVICPRHAHTFVSG